MTKKNKTIYELAHLIRSKNAGPYYLTFEMIFKKEIYLKIKNNNLFTKEMFLNAFNIEEKLLDLFIFYDPGQAIKITIQRPHISGNPGESDIYGCQQYSPLYDITIPWDE